MEDASEFEGYFEMFRSPTLNILLSRSLAARQKLLDERKRYPITIRRPQRLDSSILCVLLLTNHVVKSINRRTFLTHSLLPFLCR